MNDIDILEELIKAAKDSGQYEGNKYYKSMENIIARVKNLEEINEIHREDNGKIQKKLTQYEKYYENEKVIWSRNDNIPKSKVTQKIQELEYDQLENTKNICESRIKIQVLQELLQEER